MKESGSRLFGTHEPYDLVENKYKMYVAVGDSIRSCAQVEPMHRFLRWMAQMTCFRPKTVLLGVRTMSDVIWGKDAPKTPQKGQFQAKTPKSINRNIFGTINSTNKLFEDLAQTTKGTSLVVRHYS